MRKLLWLLLLLAPALHAQVVGPGFVYYVTSAPSGACSQAQSAQIVMGSGTIYTCQSGTWGAVGAGTGTVTSVSFTGGLISVATPTTTPALTVAGTSGGIPYFSAASTWASSAALTANLPVIGGGAGVAPSVGTVTGNTTQFATWTGATTVSRCVHTDASGNLTIAAADCGTGGVAWDAITAPSGNLSLSMGTNTSIFSGTAATNQFFAWKNTTAAVVGTSQGSPILSLCGRAFHGSADVEDCLTLKELPGNGNDASIAFSFGHTGTSTGPTPFTFPGPVLVPDGTATLPGFAFSSQPAMGLWRFASGQAVMSCNNSNCARFLNSSLVVRSDMAFGWANTTDATQNQDTGLYRLSAGVVQVGTSSSNSSGSFKSAKILSDTNCSNAAAPAVCASAAAGVVAVPTGTNPTLTINTTAVTATSQIFLQIDESATIAATTCNTTLSTLIQPVVTARTAATSFTIQIGAVIAANPACVSYYIVN